MAERLGPQLQSGGLEQSIHTGLLSTGLFGGASLDLNFAVTKTVGPLVTFTRASSAIYYGSDGLIKTAAVNEPRFDHNPTTGESLGLLVEEQRTNLLTYSEDISQWATPTNATQTPNDTTAPNGTNTADRLLETATTNLHTNDGTAFTFVTSTVYTYSVFVKPIGDRNFEIAFPATVFTARFARFTLTGLGSVQGVDSGVTASIQALPNGWYRCVATSTCASGLSSRMGNFINNASNARSYLGDTSKGIYIWGADLEVGAFPTSYIPTTTATVTRSADVASITGANFSSWYRQDEGTVFASAVGVNDISGGSTRRFAEMNDGGVNERIVLGYSSTNNTRMLLLDGGASQADIQVGTGVSAGSVVKMSSAYKINDFQQASNGTLGVADTSGTLPTVTQMLIGDSGGFGTTLNGTIRRLTYWPQRLSNSTLQTITQ